MSADICFKSKLKYKNVSNESIVFEKKITNFKMLPQSKTNRI